MVRFFSAHESVESLSAAGGSRVVMVVAGPEGVAGGWTHQVMRLRDVPTDLLLSAEFFPQPLQLLQQYALNGKSNALMIIIHWRAGG